MDPWSRDLMLTSDWSAAASLAASPSTSPTSAVTRPASTAAAATGKPHPNIKFHNFATVLLVYVLFYGGRKHPDTRAVSLGPPDTAAIKGSAGENCARCGGIVFGPEKVANIDCLYTFRYISLLIFSSMHLFKGPG